MRNCAFLSMDDLKAFECYDHLLFHPLAKLGWKAEEVSWRDKQVDWNQFEAVIIRSPWDYQEDPKAFIDVLKKIENSTARLENKLDLVTWNIDKSYLRDLWEKGIEIVPTIWETSFDEKKLESYFRELQNTEIIIKPTISANADDTFRINHPVSVSYIGRLRNTFESRPFMIQPFMDNIIREGEFSLFFFGDTYSHTILKTPKNNDFRVQEEHGGRLKKVEPGEQLLNTARELLEYIQPRPLYSRMDYVRTPRNTFALMELELIEPSLYFNMDPESPRRFANVFNQWMESPVSNNPQTD